MSLGKSQDGYIEELERRNRQINNIVFDYRGFLKAIRRLASDSLVTHPYELRQNLLKLASRARREERDLRYAEKESDKKPEKTSPRVTSVRSPRQKPVRPSGMGIEANNGTRAGAGNARSDGKTSRCPVCKRPKKPQFPYCLNCHKKMGGGPAPKKWGECLYGRCHEPVVTDWFGLPRQYCQFHQNQKDRGLIR